MDESSKGKGNVRHRLQARSHAKTSAVIALFAAPAPLHGSCQGGQGSVLPPPRVTGNTCKSGGVSGECAVERAPTTGGLFFSFFILFQMSNFSHYSDTLKWFSYFRCFSSNNIFSCSIECPAADSKPGVQWGALFQRAMKTKLRKKKKVDYVGGEKHTSLSLEYSAFSHSTNVCYSLKALH